MKGIKDFFALPEQAAKGFEMMGNNAEQAAKKVGSGTRPGAVEAGSAASASIAMSGHYSGLQRSMRKLEATGSRTADASERTAQAVERRAEDDEVMEI